MNLSTGFRQQLALWALVLGLWCLLVLAFAGHVVITSEVAWTEAVLVSLRDWFPWVVLGPVATWLAVRFPLERHKLAVSIPVHVVACLLAVLVCEWVAPTRPGALGPLPGRPPFRLREGPPPEGAPPFGAGQGPGFEGPPRRPPPLPRPRAFANALLMRARFNLPIYWVIVSFVHALTFYRRSEARERQALELEARLADAKLQALRMQLHPHFLFNTLNAISTLVHKDPQAADEMIANLSELLRATLDTAAQEIPLRQELAFLDRYLEIQQVRLGERLRIEKQIDASTLEAQVPALVLQPLVENALRHGIEPNLGTGVVSIRAARSNNTLQLAVRDNGPGMKSSAKSARGGIGLANTRTRLQELYGQEARLVFNNLAEGGCAVEVEIPYKAT